ncbi:MAG: cellulase family glycosylhydrolase [Frankiaceae bacterium]|nr:cellulase family glycosylhydrolase [Frankiaceae bacterium]
MDIPRMARRLALASVVAALVAAPLVSTATAAPAPAQLRHEGRWLVDAAGRTVVVHGVNAVWKHAPYIAPDTAEGFTAKDAAFLADNGFNGVRLGVLFAGVMPQPGVIDHAYLDKVDRIVKLLAAQQIYVLLDFHQDDYNERFTGEGFPEWAVHDDGVPFVPTGSFFANYFTPALARTFDNLWADTDGLWDRYAAGWVAVADRWANQPYLMGYDLFNEPSAGSQALTCANPNGCPQFDAKLQEFYDHVRAAIRTKDRGNLVWYEPQFFFNAVSTSHFGHIDDPQVALSWHDYACLPAFAGGSVIPGDPDCQFNEPRVMDNAETQRAEMGGGTLLTEYGSHDAVDDLARMTALADERLIGWMYWAYKVWNDPTGNPASEGMFAKDDDLSTLKAPKADVLIRPYPQAIAGTPQSLSWNVATKTMDLTYAPKSGVGPTDVFVPQRHYPGGYDAVVTGGRVTSARQARHLLVVANGTTPVRVVVRPHVPGAAGGAPAAAPPSAQPPAGELPATGSALLRPLIAALILGIGALLLKRRNALT